MRAFPLLLPPFFFSFLLLSLHGELTILAANASIITGSPAVDDVRQSASALWVNQKVLPVNGSTWFSNETWQMVHEEVLKQCDELDGVRLVSSPLPCRQSLIRSPTLFFLPHL